MGNTAEPLDVEWEETWDDMCRADRVDDFLTLFTNLRDMRKCYISPGVYGGYLGGPAP